MSPAEAAALIEEPDWVQMFDDRGRTDAAFENILTAWRRWHWTPVGEKKMPAGATEALIALASLSVMPPRTLFGDGYQYDDHCFLMSQGRQWRIIGVEDKMMILISDGEQWQINLSTATWGKYIESAAAALAARKTPESMP